ncbi:MAG: ABC transporter permease, partial [Flammeovirgaceae bacterium]
EKEAAPYAPAGWDNYLQANFPGIGGITSYTSWGMPTSIQYVAKDRILLTEELIWAESSITDLIYLPIRKGDSQKPLKGINSIVLTESAAKELFGDDDPLNQMVTVVHNWATQGKKVEMMVTAIIKDLPSNSHVRPRFVANILALKPFMPDLENLLNTSMADGNNNLFTQSYFVCNDATRIPAILDDMQKKVDAIIAKNKWDVKFKPVIRKITDVHFDSEMDWTIDHKTADIKYMYVFITIAVLILVVACINYVNLSTAKSAGRAREIGLRKTFGGIRSELFLQFMLESFVLVMMAATLAVFLVVVLSPQFNYLTGKTFTFWHIFNPTMLLILFGVIVLVTIVAGSYPALFVSGFQPATVLKGKFAFRK